MLYSFFCLFVIKKNEIWEYILNVNFGSLGGEMGTGRQGSL